MHSFLINVNEIPRSLNFPFKIKALGYQPDNYYNIHNMRYSTIDFGVELKGGDLSIQEMDGNCYRYKIPCTVTRIPEHDYGIATEEPWEVLFFSYSSDLAEDFIKSGIDFSQPGWEFKRSLRFEQILGQIMNLTGNLRKTGNADRLDQLAFQLICETRLSNPDTCVEESHQHQKILQIASFLQLHYPEDININTILRRYGFSRRTFYREWSKIYRTTPAQFIIDNRINNASGLLLKNNLSIGQIAGLSGFSNQIGFYRSFRKKHGMTPSQYRSQKFPKAV
ncbi:MAG: AraC family transcriptional regulator [Victivallales bacterium]